MNKTYALVWNLTQGRWVAVGETARRRGKSVAGKRLATAAASLLGLAALPAFALPSGETLVSGQADIARAENGKTLSINQHSDKLIANWQDFDVAGGERVSFHQPTAMSIALNRVIGNNGSRIDGQIDANGRVFLVNPNGVLFGSGARVDVGGLVASTQNLADADFLAGRYRFSGTSTQAVANHGTLTAADGGGIALLGARVANHGVIEARLGTVALAAGHAFTVNFDGSGLLNVQVDAGAVDAQASNGGLLRADGGQVLMSARSAGQLLDAVVNQTGTVEARGLLARGGRIVLDGGAVRVQGKLDAAAADASAPAGTVLTRGGQVDIANGAKVDTRAGDTAGTWTIEAANAGVARSNAYGLYPAGASIDANTLAGNLADNHVTLVNTRGDLDVAGPVSWASDRALTLTARNGSVNLQQALSAAGNDAALVVNAGDRINARDALRLTGRNARLELNAANGRAFEGDKAAVTLSGQHASFRADGHDYAVIHSVADLRNIDAAPQGRYVLGNAVDGKGANFRSIGGADGRAFQGTFDGLGNTISRLAITNPHSNVVGLFAVNTGRIANLTLRGISATGVAQPTAPLSIGALAGFNTGTLSNVAAYDVTVSARGSAHLGGLVGSNLSGVIQHARVSGRVDGDRQAAAIGGLAGENLSFLDPDARVAQIVDSSADVRVTAVNGAPTGGLVGINTGSIERASSAGSVNGGDAGLLGGLVGHNDSAGVIRAASSSAAVTARNNAAAGGLVGFNAGVISGATAQGAVKVGNLGLAGGLVGANHARIDTSTANGDVTTGANGTAGGLVADQRGHLDASTANGRVTAGADSLAGGLAGRNLGVIATATATGAVQAGANSSAGGLVALNDGMLRGSTARGNVQSTDHAAVGGLVGSNRGQIDASRAEGTVTAGAGSKAGGLAGMNAGTIGGSNATGRVVAGNSAVAGGLVGSDRGIIDASHASGSVTLGADGQAGGLVGASLGQIRNARASGNVEAGARSLVGGLVGSLVYAGAIDASSASGNVRGGHASEVGGLLGRNDRANVDGASASGNVQGGDASLVGGLVGNQGGHVTASSSSGEVSGGNGAQLGGLAGGNFGTIRQSSTTSRVVYRRGAGQIYGALAGVNFGAFAGSTASGNGADVPLIGWNNGAVSN